MIAAFALALLPVQDNAPEWGGFRGNNGTGIAPKGSVPSAWC